jgi:alkylation response protein AidB-like acyl-CoA dehydrogenase
MRLELALSDRMAIRRTLREWIRQTASAELRDLNDWRARADVPGGTVCSDEARDVRAREHPAYQLWEQAWLDAGLVCAGWPEQYGGRGWGPVELSILDELCFQEGVPPISRLTGESMVGPALMQHGTDAQKAIFLPKVISGEHKYCQGFSEPGAGSDLAAASLAGKVVGDELVMSGQKVWTSRYNDANMIFILCRTDPSAPKHAGLSYVLADYGPHNGMDIRPIRQLTGAREFAEIFFDGARAPLGNVIGGLGNGWQVVLTTLADERFGSGRTTTMVVLSRMRELAFLFAEARSNGRMNDPSIRQRLAWAYCQVESMRISWVQILEQIAAGNDPGRAASIWKLRWSEYHAASGDLAMNIRGAQGLVVPEADEYAVDVWQLLFLASKSSTIYAGTSEIQRNIIGETVLGLPREPKPQRV